ncbi:DNA phosphorothioation-dependent restriction protein DptH [Halobacillus faecis]
MSKQFFNYISEMLVKQLNGQVSPGDRYYLQMDDPQEIQYIVDAMEILNGVERFPYKHESGSTYDTFAINLNGVKLVVASTSSGVTPDFLVTLRNEVGDQKGIWQDTSLLSLVSEQLDSIQGGSSDLQKEGMPLHPQSLYHYLTDEITNSVLEKVDQVILQENLNKLIEDQYLQQVSLLDFKDIFEVLEKGSIQDKDYVNFGLFKDYDLVKKPGKELNKRLRDNRELFEYVRKAHEFSTSIEDDLDKKFSSKGVNELKKEDWTEVSFSIVYTAWEDKEKENKNAKVNLSELKVPDFKFWDRPQKETTAGNRKRQIVIFNTEQKETVSLQAKFEVSGSATKSLSSNFTKVQKQFQSYVTTKVGNKNLNIDIRCSPNDVTFARVNYKHENKASLGAEFNIVILPFGEGYLESVKTRYTVNPSKKFVEIKTDDELKIGSSSDEQQIDITEDKQSIQLNNEDESLALCPQADAFNDEGQLTILLEIENSPPLSILLNNESPDATPIRALRIWRLKRELQKDFVYDNNKLTIGNREFFTHSEYTRFLAWEDEFIKNKMLAARLESDLIVDEPLSVSGPLKESFLKLLSYFETNKTVPTLSYVSEGYRSVATNFLSDFLDQILNVSGSPAKERIDLLRLGTLKSNNGIFLTPFNPLVIAYQLQVNEVLDDLEIEQSILERLKPDALLPFIYDDKNRLYKPDPENSLKEWVKYKPVNQVTISDASSYLAKVVEDKFKQFEEHFKYLFLEGSNAPLKINIVNVNNDHEILKGILNWLIARIDKKGPEQINPIEASLYLKEVQDTAFDEFSSLKEPEEVSHKYNVKLKAKNYDEYDMLRFIRQSLRYFKFNTNVELKYAHLTFYKMMGEENIVFHPMNEMITGVSLDGLLSSVPSMKSQDSYKSGFGIKAYEDSDSQLLKVIKGLNELAANCNNQGFNAYSKSQSIMSRTTIDDEETLESLFNSSYWVTFLDPTVDLDFFQSYQRNLVVIHYSDQYTSSSRYDAITVTDKSSQYNNAIKEFLHKHDINVDDHEVNQVIKAFNAFNGEWLLRIVGSKGYYDKEKLSIISAIKYSLTYFNHKDIMWVPISLEEVLRVAGAVGLNKKNGVFTAKNLGVSGSHSDDLLLIGLETDKKEVKLHFYPIEVKIGHNNSAVIDKAKEQLRNTKKLFEENLTKVDVNGKNNFNHQFYRQFFVQLLIANMNKLKQSGLWDEKSYSISNDVRYKLLSDQFEVSEQFIPIIGKGAIVSFERERYVRTVDFEDQITILNLPESDGFKGIVEPVHTLANDIVAEKTDFPIDNLLYYNYKYNSIEEDDEFQEYVVGKHTLEHEHEDKPIKDDIEEPLTFPENNLEDVRVLIGEAVGSNKKIYWEYGNKQLANRHMLISGKSGQGKTYFMQCLLLEQALHHISSIIIDYTEGFLPNQLEVEFVESLGEKLSQSIVYNEGFPINPFKKNMRNIGGIELQETETDIAERIKSVFSAVYSSLGIQQLNAIYEATKKGVGKYGDQMTLTQLKFELEELGTSYAQKTLSQISNLIDRNPFRSGKEEMDWGKIINSDGTVNVIQLTGYPRDVQLMITEFILWDLWNYSVRNGNKDYPIPVVMDEAQNLDHRENSPSARILTEGRKFGWSGWYATQFLKSQLDSDELARLQNSSQKIYFSPPEQEVSTIANSLAKDKEDKRYWEQKLSSLKKGQCIVHAPIRLPNGELSNPVTQVVNISSLNSRI